MTEWQKMRLSETMKIIGGGTPKTTISEYWDGDIPWLSVVDFNNDNRWVYSTEKSITEKGLQESSTKILKKGQLIISARGTVGAIAQLARDMTFNQSCYGLDANQKITSNDFLYYAINNIVDDVQKSTHGAIFDTITTKTFDHLYISFPPLDCQNAIVELLTALDDKIELNQHMCETLEKTASTLFKSWFIDFSPVKAKMEGRTPEGMAPDIAALFPDSLEESKLGLIPKGWEVKKVFDVGNIVLGGTPSRKRDDYWGGNIPWINSGKTNEFRVLEPSEFISREGLDNSSAKLLPVGTTILAITGATLGQVSRLEIEATANQSVIGIIPSKFSNEFIYLFTKHAISNIINRQTGGAQQHINRSDVMNYPIIFPSLDVFEVFQVSVVSLFNKIRNNSLQTRALAGLRDSLLPRLISGKLRVKDVRHDV